MAPLANITQIEFYLVATIQKVNFDYTPEWIRGKPSSYIDKVTFPRVLTDKKYLYRVVRNGKDLGEGREYSAATDGSLQVNFLDYNGGYGIPENERIQVYAVDPDTGNSYLIAQWK